MMNKILLFFIQQNKKWILLCSILSLFHVAFPQGGVWTWISGTNTTGSSGVFGIQGIPSVTNHPPASYESCEWKDNQGNFWLYGGFAPNYSDLWKFNPSTLEWTWVKGNGLTYQNPVYGIKGVPDVSNSPGQRQGASFSWVDSTGNLWLFACSGYRNDLWKYNIGSNEWTWMSGDSVLNAWGVYGTQGIPSASNVPGARQESCSAWTDSLNNLWLFGGWGLDNAGGFGYLNDLWRYNIASNDWTWMKGSNTIGATGNYGTLGVSNATNEPGARFTYTKWKDLQGNLWFMGGGSYPYRNDMWKYEGSTNEWTWMTGSNLPNNPGVYLGLCMNDTINFPAARYEQRSAVTDNCGNFWLFGGGDGTNWWYLNDLWVFNPQQTKWNWIFGTAAYSVGGYFGTLGIPSTFNQPPSCLGANAWWGNDNRFYLFGGCQGNTLMSYSAMWVFTPDTNCIQICNCIAATPSVTQSQDTLFVTNNYHLYQWYHDATLIGGATNYFYVATQSGDYNVVATDSNGCEAEAAIFKVIANTPALSEQNLITIFPNPGSEKLYLNSSINIVSLKLLDFIGKELFTETVFQNSLEMDIRFLSDGIYFLQVQTEKGIFTKRFIKE